MAPGRKYLEMFLEEAAENISRLNERILRLEEVPADGEALQSALRLAHTLKGGAKMVGLENVSRAAHGLEGELQQLARGGTGLTPERSTALLGILDRVREVLDLLASNREPEALALDCSAERVDAQESKGPLRGEKSPEPTGAPAARAVQPWMTAQGDGDWTVDRVRVSAERLDMLQNLVDDLVLQKAKLRERAYQFRKDFAAADGGGSGYGGSAERERSAPKGEWPTRRGASDLLEDLHQLDQMIGELQAHVLDLRMVPLAEILDKYHRVVRDLARELSKDVALSIDGKFTELDRRLLEAIQAPLMHLVRNAVDHGVESPAERVACGKSVRAQVTIRAYHKGGSVVIEVEDDGRGLDPDWVREKAIARGILDPETARNMSDEEVYYLLCEPGFTTRDTVTEVSGRGIGLDVVKVRVEKVKGSLSIQSERGRFTRFRLHLPLSLSSLSALIFRVGSSLYAVPSLFVERCLKVESEKLASWGGTWAHEDRILPVVSLAGALGLETRTTTGPTCLVILKFRNRNMVIQVDALADEREIVLKSFGDHLRDVPYVLGASFLSDGSVLPVLNVVDFHARWGVLEAACRFRRGEPTRAPVILVVDDSVTTRHLEKNILEGLGYQVLEASDGLEARGILERQPVDLVLTDVEMPNMDGLELARAIRRSGSRSDLPVVAVSNRTSEEDIQAGREAGFDAYLRKDRFSQGEMARTLDALLASRSGVSAGGFSPARGARATAPAGAEAAFGPARRLSMTRTVSVEAARLPGRSLNDSSRM